MEIELNHQEYTLPFTNPQGAGVRCTILDGEGKVTLYEVKRAGKIERQTEFLSVSPGYTLSLTMNTAKRNSSWQIVFIGTGKFLLEFQSKKQTITKRLHSYTGESKKLKNHKVKSITKYKDQVKTRRPKKQTILPV